MKFRIIPKNLLFLRSFNLAKLNSGKIVQIIFFDVIFFVSMLIVKNLVSYSNQILGVPQTIADFYLRLFYSIVYFLALLFLYSFFKYIILNYIKSLFDRTKISFKRLGKFYSLNIILMGIFVSVALFFNFVLFSIKAQFRPYVFIMLAVPFLLFFYTLTNLSHSIFCEDSSIKNSIKNSLSILFRKIKSYREIISLMILLGLILWLIFLGVGKFVNTLASRNYDLYLSIYPSFERISIVVFDLAVYFTVLINRISFYAVIREKSSIKNI